jgi:two-component system LytT family sensor kinase
MKKSLLISLQLAYWAFFLFVVFMLISASWPDNNPRTVGKLFSYMFLSPIGLLYILSSVAGFYVFYFLIFPAFLNKKRIRRMLLYGALFSILISLTVWTIRLASVFEGVYFSFFISVVLLVALLTFANGVMALLIRGFVKWLHDIKLNEALNEKRYQTEIELLKSKINPHFLFNTINNIDMLISTDPMKASQYLNELSDIMRFMLYETKGDRIPLSKELGYIQKYIDLQRIRSSNAGYVTYSTSGDYSRLSIAPMLFIPFMENAFKYAENKKSENAIVISIGIHHNSITFECRNRYPALPVNDLNAGGLGNELMKKRLQLLYPDKHSLEITDQDDFYTVKLIIHTDAH